MRMNIHKFNSKPKTTQPKTIYWRPLRRGKISGYKSRFDYLGNFWSRRH